ncbi:MAG TPA: hypothetical protein VN448_08570 [Gammaproteobacteria bacterium]|nr:hypothetical protein [Gammaproteobacteria bacterium]
MASALELYDSRVSRIDEANGIVSVHFSHAYIHKSSGAPGKSAGTGWSQEAVLTLFEVGALPELPPLPNTIAEGFLEVGGIRHELIPLPFKRKVGARLVLVFVDGAQIEIVGDMPVIELKGSAIFLEDFS